VEEIERVVTFEDEERPRNLQKNRRPPDRVVTVIAGRFVSIPRRWDFFRTAGEVTAGGAHSLDGAEAAELQVIGEIAWCRGFSAEKVRAEVFFVVVGENGHDHGVVADDFLHLQRCNDVAPEEMPTAKPIWQAIFWAAMMASPSFTPMTASSELRSTIAG